MNPPFPFPVFVTYETPHSPCGGIAAVLANLPRAVKQVSGLRTTIIAPFHHNLPSMKRLSTEVVGTTEVPFENSRIPVDVHHVRMNGCDWFYLLPRDRGFFAGSSHPYDCGEDLLRDSLFFTRSVKAAVSLFFPEETCCFFMQDWEAASLVFHPALRRQGHLFFLTLHNSYDVQATDGDLWRFGIPSEESSGETILLRALPHANKPVLTVSRQFAFDLTEEVWQRSVMAPHLQALLRNNLHGIDNGSFMDPAIGEKTLRRARGGDFSSLRRWKTLKRKQFLEKLRTLFPTLSGPVWGDWKSFTGNRDPWFVMAGREDPRQKGYDVAAHAVRTLLERGFPNGRFLFFPLPAGSAETGLPFLERLAEDFPDRVLVFSFPFREGFHLALQGSTYGLMPSFYEPFGMVSEFYCNGTVAIGRATGGIVNQIVPYKGRCFSSGVRKKVERAFLRGWYGESPEPTGILFREDPEISESEHDWRRIHETASAGGDCVDLRREIPLFRAMSDSLATAILEGIELYNEHPETYFRMLVNGIDYIQRTFSWEKTACSYLELLE